MMGVRLLGKLLTNHGRNFRRKVAPASRFGMGRDFHLRWMAWR